MVYAIWMTPLACPHPPAGFLTTTSTFLAASPTPALYTQADLTQPAQAHPAQQLPPQHQHLLSQQLQQQLGADVPAAVARHIDKTLLRPLQLWRTALRAAQVRSSSPLASFHR
jgi:hypothetical protein